MMGSCPPLHSPLLEGPQLAFKCASHCTNHALQQTATDRLVVMSTNSLPTNQLALKCTVERQQLAFKCASHCTNHALQQTATDRLVVMSTNSLPTNQLALKCTVEGEQLAFKCASHCTNHTLQSKGRTQNSKRACQTAELATRSAFSPLLDTLQLAFKCASHCTNHALQQTATYRLVVMAPNTLPTNLVS
jgi:hypothetical protein